MVTGNGLKNIVIDVRPLMGGNVSGVEIYIRYLLKYLFSLDSKNNYILFANSHKDQSQFFPKFDSPNVFYVQTNISNRLLNLLLSFFGLPKLDKLILQALYRQNYIDENKLNRVRSINGIDLFFQPDLRPVALSSHVKRVVTVHDLSFLHFPQFFSVKTRWWYRLLRPKHIIRNADKIIAVSQATSQDLQKSYGIDAKKISIIYEGVEESFGTIDTNKFQQIREKYGLPEKFFLSLCTLEPRKNLNGLLKAFEYFGKQYPQENIQLVLAGRKNEKIFSAVTFPKNKNVRKRIYLPGFIDEADKPYLYAMAEAFIYPSLFEGFGLPLVEAMQVGTPIITSNVSSMPEIVDNAAITIDPKNVKDLAQAMKRVLDPQIRESLKRKMMRRIQNFRWEDAAKETLKIFEQL